jgi:acetyltransferase-like isoleucine patch superfamily enzyme
VKNPFDPGYFSENDLQQAGFKTLGKSVRIAKNCTIIGLENIEIGNNVRIDGYCSLIAANPGFLKIGSFIHIGAYSLLSAGSGITIEDFAGLSQSVKIYSQSDDYTGNHLTNPTVPEKFTGVTRGMVTVHRHVIIGSGSVILPSVTIGEGCAVGALSLVNRSLEEWGIYTGCPTKKIRDRSKQLLTLEKRLLTENTSTLLP